MINEKESRLIFLFKEVGPNMREYGSDLNTRYLTGPYDRGNTIQKIMGPIGAAASVVLEGPNYLGDGIVDNRVHRAQGAIGRTRRDVGSLLKNVVTLHPIRAVSDVFKVPTSVVMDGYDLVGGFHTAT